jgi:hypothetical protein
MPDKIANQAETCKMCRYARVSGEGEVKRYVKDQDFEKYFTTG